MFRHSILCVALAGGLSAALFTGPATAQPAANRSWMWSFDIGGGSASLTVNDVSADREIGSAFGIRGAYVFKPNMALGLTADSWFGGVNDTSYSFGIVGPSLTVWPGGSGFSLRGVLGFGFLDAGDGEWTEEGVGGLAAAAYEFEITRTVKFGPQLAYGYVTAGDNATADWVQVSFILNWYPSKPADAESPPSEGAMSRR